MDLNGLKTLAKNRPAVWVKCGPFDLQVRRISLLDIDRINREANDLQMVDEVVHAVCNEQRLIKAYLDEVRGWKGVQVQHIVAKLAEDSPYALTDEVPFDRELLTILVENYPFICRDLAPAMYRQALSYALELDNAKKK